jgi:hypothetical protein
MGSSKNDAVISVICPLAGSTIEVQKLFPVTIRSLNEIISL